MNGKNNTQPELMLLNNPAYQNETDVVPTSELVFQLDDILALLDDLHTRMTEAETGTPSASGLTSGERQWLKDIVFTASEILAEDESCQDAPNLTVIEAMSYIS